MYLQHLTLRDYRNYQSVDTDFSPQINVLIGANAQGKTNLLESVYALALARSHRTNNDRDLIRFGSEFARVDGTVVRSTGPVKLGLVVSKQGKRARINGRDAPRLSQYLGKLNVILFAPEDLNLVKGSPALRRRFIDMEFGQMSAKYLYNLAQYKVTLKQRNAYLKQLKYGQARDTVYLDVLTEQLAQFGAAVAVARAELLATWVSLLALSTTTLRVVGRSYSCGTRRRLTIKRYRAKKPPPRIYWRSTSKRGPENSIRAPRWWDRTATILSLSSMIGT